MASVSAEEESRNPATCLTDDIIVEILSRLPVKSVCRFKSMCKHWHGLISQPGHREKLPQTLAGFFYHTRNIINRYPEDARYFTNVTGRGEPLVHPSLSFLPAYADITVLDCCNGLLLCRSPTATAAGGGANRNGYVVCNPATEEWAALPEFSQDGDICEVRLGFDPAVSSNFHVFAFVGERKAQVAFCVDELVIYSSETGQWAHRDSGWSVDVTFWIGMSTVFLNSFLHVLSTGLPTGGHQEELGYHKVLVVDTKGNSWRTIPLPKEGDDDGFIGHCQGHLYYLNRMPQHDMELSVYVLEDYASDEWIFKHSVNITELIGMGRYGFLHMPYDPITIHTECHLIFFVSDLDKTIRCYDMDNGQVRVIHKMGPEHDYKRRCLAYVPCYKSFGCAWN